ncbi:MAG TPA: COR domain-containing protein [Nitrospira sp.]|nr:COR domain-containing protein [Nitrospira sp.]
MDGLQIARRLIAEEREKKTGFLDLGNLQLTEVPVELFELTHLRGLNLGTWYVDEHGRDQKSRNSNENGINELRTLPSAFSTLGNLTTLSLHGNPIGDLSPLAPLTALQQLNCSDTQVSDLSPLHTLTALQHLDCLGTPISDLSPLSPLTALQQLHCWNTQVSDLSPLHSLTALQQLNYSNTQVSDLSPLHTLTALQQLNYSNTQVSDLSPLHTLTALQQLNCSDTQVSDLSPLIGLLNLGKLAANNLRLEDFPRQLLFQKILQELTLYGTTIPGIPAEILSDYYSTNCLDNLCNHLLDVEHGSEKVCEAKLVVLGNGRVGKTQICRRLRGLPYDEAVPSTHGITVTAEPWAGSTSGEVLNIWDFGGQDIYHGAHTLFMKTSAVFLIAWHPDFEATGEQPIDGQWFRNYPLSYWLDYVRTLGRKDCPILVVQTRCDRPEQEVRRLPVDDAFLTFPSLKPCWYSAKTPRGQGALNDALHDAIRYLRERDGIVAIGIGGAAVIRQLETWRNEDQALPTEQRLHRTLSQEEFRNLCAHTGGVRSPESLLAYLHNVGVVFYQPHLFDNRIILDQSWALDAVYAVFDRQETYPYIRSLRGRFTQSLLALSIWRDYSDAEQQLFLSLMESCGIAFIHREAEPKLGLPVEYLAPDLLPDKDAVADQLTGRWNDQEESRQLIYDYPFLHTGLMRALLCDIGSRSKEAGVYWKYGAWLYETSTGCRALIEQQMQDDRRGRIVLTVQGLRHQELVRWLRERIEQRNRLFGHPELPPTVDDLSKDLPLPVHPDARRLVESQSDELASTSTAARMAQEPIFGKPPESFFPSHEPLVFISYAWGDDTPAGQQRAKVVDDLCAALGQHGITVRRDQAEMRPGDLISEFMDRLTEGDCILVVISDKYLRSEYCMYELFRIFRNCADKPERFLRKVIPLLLPDSKIDELDDRLERAVHWTTLEEKLESRVKDNVVAVGTEFFRKFKLIGEFARNTSDMLEHLVDKLQPRDFDRQAQEGFKEILDQITRRR